MAQLSPLRGRTIRGHDGPQHVAGDAAILRQRGFEVQPEFWPVARRSIWDITGLSAIRTWQPPTRWLARWTRRRPPWRKPAV